MYLCVINFSCCQHQSKMISFVFVFTTHVFHLCIRLTKPRNFIIIIIHENIFIAFKENCDKWIEWKIGKLIAKSIIVPNDRRKFPSAFVFISLFIFIIFVCVFTIKVKTCKNIQFFLLFWVKRFTWLTLLLIVVHHRGSSQLFYLSSEVQILPNYLAEEYKNWQN